MFIGNLTANPDLRYAPSGMGICKFSIACNESYLKDGKKEERVEFVRIVTFQKQAENCSNYLHKGSLVFVEGSLSTNKWTDQQGQTRYTTEIKAQRVQFLERKGDRQGQGMPASDGYSRQQNQPQDDADDLGPAFPSEASGMDDVPF